MAIVTKKHFVGGDTPTATELNKPYDDLASSDVTEENTADRWVNREIVNEAGIQPNELYWASYVAGAVMTTNSTTEVVVNNGGNREIVLNYTATNDIIVRATADGVVQEVKYENWTTNSWYNLYQFSIWVTHDGGVKTRLTYGNFSLVKMAHALYGGPPSVVQKTIQWRNFQLGGFLSFPAGTLIEKVELLVKVGYIGNSIEIGRSNLSLVIAEN
jgi:hypothetical protein